MKRGKNKRKTYKLKAKTEFKLFIRQRDNFTCVICGNKGEGNDIHAGHYIHLESLDLDSRNMNAQCSRCNAMHNKNPVPYTNFMVLKYGEEILDELDRLSRENKKLTGTEYEEVYHRYKKLNDDYKSDGHD